MRQVRNAAAGFLVGAIAFRLLAGYVEAALPALLVLTILLAIITSMFAPTRRR